MFTHRTDENVAARAGLLLLSSDTDWSARDLGPLEGSRSGYFPDFPQSR
jgi:hypothetical protein